MKNDISQNILNLLNLKEKFVHFYLEIKRKIILKYKYRDEKQTEQ